MRPYKPKQYPSGIGALARIGVNFPRRDQDRIQMLLETGDIAAAQRMILHRLHYELDPPIYRVQIGKDRRKRIVLAHALP